MNKGCQIWFFPFLQLLRKKLSLELWHYSFTGYFIYYFYLNFFFYLNWGSHYSMYISIIILNFCICNSENNLYKFELQVSKLLNFLFITVGWTSELCIFWLHHESEYRVWERKKYTEILCSFQNERNIIRYVPMFPY